MSGVERLAAIQNRRLEVAEARELLTVLLDLPSVDVEIRNVLISGTGSASRVAIDLSNGERMQFDSLREMSTATVLAAELVACTGALPKLTRKEGLLAVKYTRAIAQWERTQTAADIAFDWGCGYLQAADTLTMDLDEQTQRWAAFSRLKEIDPWSGGPFAAATTIVLAGVDGSRWVRSSWFHAYVRQVDKHYSQEQVASRMAEIGWTRRGESGRIKATCPARPETLGWAFFIVPPAWEGRGSGSEVPAGVYRSPRASAPAAPYENGTGWNLGTGGGDGGRT